MVRTTCPTCGGGTFGDESGPDHRGRVSCPQCGGSGGTWFEEGKEFYECTLCRGSGLVLCPQCGGTGMIDKE